MSSSNELVIDPVPETCAALPVTPKPGRVDMAFVPPMNTERDRLFDSDWLFHRAEVKGAEAPGFDDTGWRKLDVPANHNPFSTT